MHNDLKEREIKCRVSFSIQTHDKASNWNYKSLTQILNRWRFVTTMETADGSDEETQRSPSDEDPTAASFELHEEEYENEESENEVGENEEAENEEARRQS